MAPLLKRKRRVLLLDDDPSMQRLVSSLLRRAGYRVDCFLTGWDAMAALTKNEYAALLLDLMMPHEGGTTVIRHLRKSNPELLRRTIVVTGSPKRVVAAVARDVAAVITKPFEKDELLRVVETISAPST
jgi:CheY-like chemotaxis protein